jgi:VWFA-related protein
MSRQPALILLLCGALTLTAVARQQDPPRPQAQEQQPSPPLPQPRPPVFRAGAHYVRVDAYPTEKGHIVEGLTKDDFEIYEDGKLQAIESAEFVTFDTWTPEGERKDPRTQQDAYDLAADPTWRVFVIVIDPNAYNFQGRHYMRAPLHEFIDRNLGPKDLFGLLTTESEWNDLALGQKTTFADSVIDSREWIYPRDETNERYAAYTECGFQIELILRKKLDDEYILLEGLVRLLALIRQERKSIVFVANSLPHPEPMKQVPTAATGPDLPKIGVTSGGRIGEMPRGDRVGAAPASGFCNSERMRLANMDFDERFRDLLKSARQGNVAFYPVSPLGLQTIPFKPSGAADLAAFHAMQNRTDSLLTLASETDGIAVVNTNDLTGGMRRVANDVNAYYVLGYYTTNTRWDGGIRSIKVKVKPKRNTIRARRQYRAPTLAEIAALSSPAATNPAAPPSAEETALAALSRDHPTAPFVPFASRAGSQLSIVLEIPASASPWPTGTEIMAMAESADGELLGSAREVMKSGGRVAIVRVPIASGQPPAYGMLRVKADGMIFTDRVAVPPASPLLGDALAFRNGTPTAVLSCRHNDVVHLEWPVLGALDTREVRLLDRHGKPLPVPLQLEEKDADGSARLVTDVPLAPLGRGDYLVELRVGSKTISDRKLIALRVN